MRLESITFSPSFINNKCSCFSMSPVYCSSIFRLYLQVYIKIPTNSSSMLAPSIYTFCHFWLMPTCYTQYKIHHSLSCFMFICLCLYLQYKVLQHRWGRSLKNIKCIVDGGVGDCCWVFCVNVIAVLSEAQLLTRDIEELLDLCTSTGPSNQRRNRMVRIEAGIQILGQTSWNHVVMTMSTIFP